MSRTRTPDVVLADHFTRTQHHKASPAIDPSLPTNKLPPKLNVCIIGASRGIGASVAYAYAQAGICTLILAARPSSSAQLADVQRRCNDINPNVKIVLLDVDITSVPSVAQLAHNIQTHIPTLDILILNSGYSGPVVLRLTSGDPVDFQDVFDVNVQGTYLVAHFLLPLLLANKEGAKTFLVVGSLAACITSGHIANTAYCVSKFAQTRLVEFIATQYADEGVLCVAVHPGAVLTEMADSTTPESFRKCEFVHFLCLLPVIYYSILSFSSQYA
jgi:NAD(P)-dependent dehydrogenase (short-subunit alcohol dehydrogenase family)